MVRALAHGAVGRRIDPSWGEPIELFLVVASATTNLQTTQHRHAQRNTTLLPARSETWLRGKSVRSWCDRSSDRSLMVDLLSYFSFEPVLQPIYKQRNIDTRNATQLYYWLGARCSSVVRAFAHRAMGRRIDPSWWTWSEMWLRGKSVRSWCDGSSDRSFMVERDVAPWQEGSLMV